jgi:hypothetical protein
MARIIGPMCGPVQHRTTRPGRVHDAGMKTGWDAMRANERVAQEAWCSRIF